MDHILIPYMAISRIVDKRIDAYSKFTFNDIFKRNFSNFSDIKSKKWKTNQKFQFLFFVFLSVFDEILDKDVFKHNCILVYIIYSLWSKDELEVNYIQRLINLYSTIVEDLNSRNDYTPNLHQFSNHVIEQYENHGKFSLNNAFLFEHLNDIVNRQVKSSFGVLEQISSKSEISFSSKIKFSTQENKSKLFKTNCKEKITKIFNDYFKLSSIESKTKSKDYFVMTDDNRFYKILKFYKLNGCLFFKGLKFRIESEYKFNLNFSRFNLDSFNLTEIKDDLLTLDYAFNVQLLSSTIELNVNCIKEKVLFCPNFDRNSSKFKDSKKGIIFRNVLEFHN